MLLSKVSIHAFIQEHQIKTETGSILDFRTHRYLFDIYADNSAHLCCIKAGQIGFSTMAIIKTIWLAYNRGINIGYILPTSEMVEKFVGSKVNRIAQQNPVISKMMKDKDKISEKQIGDAYIFYLGSQTDRSAIMLSLDLIVGDEFDKSPQEVMETYDSRLQHSKFGWKWVFSNPTLPDFGVDRFWAISDQKKWFITHSCGRNYVMDESCLDYQSVAYRCPHCKGEITDEERRMGEWKPTAKGEWSGYWIPLWINPMIQASVIAGHKKDKTKEYFANFVAGVPYVNPNDALSLKALSSCLSPQVNDRSDSTIIGIDTGHDIYYTMMNKQGTFYHGHCDSVEQRNEIGYDPYDEIDRRMKDDPKAILIADQGGDLIGVRKLQQKYSGRVFLCYSNREMKGNTLVKWGEGDKFGEVYIDRNRSIQLFVDEINEKRPVFNGSLEDWTPFFNHCLNIYRTREIQGDQNDPQYGWKWVWKRKGPDHWFMSSIYARIGLDKFASQKAVIVGNDMFAGLETARIFE